MLEKDLKDLLDRYHNGTATPQERRDLEHWYAHLARSRDLEGVDDATLAEEGVRIWEAIDPAKGKKIGSLWVKMFAVAATLAIVAGGVLFFNHSWHINKTTAVVKTSPVVPGKPGATLTLANGKKLDLKKINNGQLIEGAGITMLKIGSNKLVCRFSGSKHMPNQVHHITTAKGQSFQCRLPDGTDIWMNANSDIAFSSSLTQAGQRVVKLTGEAYFEVAKDKKHPFIVETTRQKIKVLGTHFNVTAYEDDDFAVTTLLEGAVAMGNGAKLKPGQQAVTNSRTMVVKEADLSEAVAWKNGNFIFNAEDINSVIRKLARWYNIELDYQGSKIPDATFSGEISRRENIQNIISQINYTGAVRLKLDGRRIVIMP